MSASWLLFFLFWNSGFVSSDKTYLLCDCLSFIISSLSFHKPYMSFVIRLCNQFSLQCYNERNFWKQFRKRKLLNWFTKVIGIFKLCCIWCIVWKVWYISDIVAPKYVDKFWKSYIGLMEIFGVCGGNSMFSRWALGFLSLGVWWLQYWADIISSHQYFKSYHEMCVRIVMTHAVVDFESFM